MHKRRITLASFLMLTLALSIIYLLPLAHQFSHNLFGDYHHSFGIPTALAATTATSVKSGNWSDPTVWSTRNIPGSADSVTIISGHTITYDLADSRIAGLLIADSAKLVFAPGKTALLRTNKNILLLGELEMKPSSANIHHTIRFVDVNELAFVGGGMDVFDSDIGLWVRGNGFLDLAGTPKTAWTRLQGRANAGSATITLQSAPTGWRVGDEISVVPTEPTSAGDASQTGFDLRTIAAISGNTVTLNSPLSRNHPVATDPNSGRTFTAEVLNLSRNVHIEGTGSGSPDPAGNGRAHVQILSGVPQFVRYAEFKLLGPRAYTGESNYTAGVLGRYALHFHHSRDGSRGSLIEGTVVRKAGGHAYVPHASHGITFRDTISYDTFEDAYWWDPPPRLPDRPGVNSTDPVNDSDDVLYDRAVAAITKNHPSFRADSNGFSLMPGLRNGVRDSVAVGMAAAGFVWPEAGSKRTVCCSGVWDFDQGNIAHNNGNNGIFTWQNNAQTHIVANFVGYHNKASFISHGAYENGYQYRDIVGFANAGYGLEVHSTTRTEPNVIRPDGYGQAFERYVSDGELYFPNHRSVSHVPTLIKDCVFTGVVINDTRDGGGVPSRADIVNCTKPNGQSIEPADFTILGANSGLDIRVQRPNGTAYHFGNGGSVNPISAFYDTGSSPPTNQAPSVDAGPGSTVSLPGPANLNGTISDDGLPNPPGAVTTTWRKVSGPGAVTFGNSSAVDTTATFSAAGTYILEFLANDSSLASTDQVTITVTSGGPSPSLVSNLTVASGRVYQVVDGGFNSGARTFIDRDYTVTSAPSKVDGATYVQTANDDKDRSDSTFLSFSVNVDSTVYVAYDARATSRPNWLSSWSSTPEIVGTSDVPFNLYFRDYSANAPVSLGGNQAPGAAGAGSNYFVVIVPGSGPVNQPPVVDAGPDVTTTMPSAIALDATVSDDGLPNPPGAVTTMWSKVSGPGTVTFGNPHAVDTTAGFSAAGVYVLRLSANDGELTAEDRVTVTVIRPNQPPSVNAGQDQSVTFNSPATAILDASVSDDGQPNPPGAVTTMWSKVSGPGAVTFGNPHAVDTTVAFTVAGVYVLRISADDGDQTAEDRVTVTVIPPNLPPSVDAGQDQSVTFNSPATAILDAAVSDDGQPSPPSAVTTMWSKVSGPGAVTFGNPHAVDTTAGFAVAGVYVLRLSADDGDLTAEDLVTMTVTQPISHPLVISNLLVASGGPYQVVDQGLVPGATTYIDRSYTLTSVPGSLSGATYIRTANDDKTRTDNPFMSFLVNQRVTVYVAYDSRASSRPNWLASWNNTGHTIGTTDVSFDLYSHYSNSSTGVSLGANLSAGAAGVESNYFVVVVPASAVTPNNQAPLVDAGPDAIVPLTDVASLNGTVSDDGLPDSPGFVSTLWQLVSGPSPVSFGSATTLSTGVSFASVGTYIMGLFADDGELFSFDEVTITVVQPNQAPLVNAGPDLTITLPDGTALNGSVSDDGLPNPPAEVTAAWSTVSGPGTVTFGNATAVDTTANFSAAGVYVLQLSADDGDLASVDEATVTVLEPDPDQPLSVADLSAASGKAYQVVDNGLASGAAIFIDRGYTVTSAPGSVSGATYIQTANDDKYRTDDPFLSFSVDRPVTVYVAYDHRASSLPNWLSSWDNTGDSIGTTDVTFNLLARDFAPGSVSLGGNRSEGAAGAHSNYFVVIAPN